MKKTDDMISRQAALDAPFKKFDADTGVTWIPLEYIEKLPSAQPEIIRCKDCKHRPTGENRDDLEFPDEMCPCQCEDFWYNWKPADNWFCENGERRDGEQ